MKFVKPRHAVDENAATAEAQLRALWREILEVEEVGPNDTFFDLGGESISGTMCANRIQELFGVRIPLSLLLDESTTLAVLAAKIEASVDRG